jgi:hypothetical protein
MLKANMRVLDDCGELNKRESEVLHLFRIVPIHKWLFCPISAVREKFYPQNINYMPPVKLFAHLDLDQNPSFLHGHYDRILNIGFHGSVSLFFLIFVLKHIIVLILS